MKLFHKYWVLFAFCLLGFTQLQGQTLQLSSPNGGEVWVGGSTKTISWTYNNVDNIKIEYSTM
jgi:hypothetical protein